MATNGVFVVMTGANGFKYKNGRYYVSYNSSERQVTKEEYFRLKTTKAWLGNSLLIAFGSMMIFGFYDQRQQRKKQQDQLDSA